MTPAGLTAACKIMALHRTKLLWSRSVGEKTLILQCKVAVPQGHSWAAVWKTPTHRKPHAPYLTHWLSKDQGNIHEIIRSNILISLEIEYI